MFQEKTAGLGGGLFNSFEITLYERTEQTVTFESVHQACRFVKLNMGTSIYQSIRLSSSAAKFWITAQTQHLPGVSGAEQQLASSAAAGVTLDFDFQHFRRKQRFLGDK